MIDLYHKMQCPHSAKVRENIDQQGIRSQIQFHDIENEPRALSNLKDLIGKSQVPCLVVDGRPILESDDIIQWIQKNLH